MGVNYSYMNVWALSTIMRITGEDVEKIYDLFENDQLKQDNDAQVTDFKVTEWKLVEYLESLAASSQDIDVFVDLFRLMDNRGFGSIDIRDILISVTVLTTTSVQECLLKT